MEQPVSIILRDKANNGLHTLTPDMTVSEAVHRMNGENIGAVAVVRGERLAGVFTERDVLRRVIDTHLDPDTTRLEDVMTTEVIVISPSTTVGEAMVLVDTQNCRHLPVCEGDRLIGMVSMRDLIGAVVDTQKHRIEELTDYIYGNYGPPSGGAA